MSFGFVRMHTRIKITAALATIVALLTLVDGISGENLTDLMEHVLPAYAVAKNSDILGQSSDCRRDLERFKEGVDTRRIWSLRMLDSSGEPKPGFIYGNNYWIGSRSQCLDTLNTEPLALHPKWLQNNTLYRKPEEELAPYQLNYFAAQFLHNSTLQYHHRLPNEHAMTLGLCLPATCGTDELGMILENIFNERTLFVGELYDMDFKLLHVKNLNDDRQYLMNFRMITVAVVIVLTLLMMLMGTCYDVCVHQKRIKAEKLSSISNNNMRQIGVKSSIENGNLLNSSWKTNVLNKFGKVLHCFSVYTNSKNLFDTSSSGNGMALIHGLRFIGMVWIIMIHTILYGQDYADNKTWSWRMSMDFPTQVISNGTLSVDTYFFLSGFLLGLVFFKSRNKKTDCSNKRSRGFRWGNLMEAIAKRFIREISDSNGGDLIIYKATKLLVSHYTLIRLTPAYMMVVGIVEMNAGFYDRTSQFYMNERPQDTCPKYWWRNLLYINNFFSRDEMCLSWSWYLSDDTQFFVIGMILLLMSSKYLYTTVAVFMTMLFTSCFISGYVAYNYNYVPTLDEQWNTLEIFYDPPWMRIGPYLIGLATAWMLFKMKNKLEVKKKTLWLLWIIGSSCNLLVLFGLFNRTISIVPTSIYMAVNRTVWAIGIAWVVIACCTKHGGIVNTILTFKAWIPLSKLTYCAYLLNPFLITSIYFSSESSFHVDFLPNGAAFLGNLVITYSCAYAAYLMFEVPYILLAKLYFDARKK